MKKTSVILFVFFCFLLFSIKAQAQAPVQLVYSKGGASLVTTSQLINNITSIAKQQTSTSQQNSPWCASDEVTNTYIQTKLQGNPNYLNQMNTLHQQILNIINNGNYNKQAMAVRTIPVVVHVVHNPSNSNNPTENVSDAVIFDMINTLNEDFRRLNPDTVNTRSVFVPVAADSELEFCLASKNQSGQRY